jgi:hypothetical protein
VFPHLEALRAHLLKMSDAVETVYLYRAGVGIGFAADRMLREKLVRDAEVGCEILRLVRAME